MNELKSESSPYLLQHAENPVHWKAWSSATSAKAKNDNKLIIISIGYSTCHWCHVMEHESFEDQEVANMMNDHFTNIKVDREERPDVDAVYMKAVQLMGGQGGWPLNVVALPDGRPIWGGTYFPKKDWLEYLNQLAALFANEPSQLLAYAEKLHEGIESISVIKIHENQQVAPNLIEELVSKWKRSFDHEFGGMAKSPKFMLPNNYQFLLRYAHENKDADLLKFINLTLTKMAYGGLFDTVAGGFSRYSVDVKWHVPHFEKMLYDNAQLVSLYSDAYKLTKNELYRKIVQKTTRFVSDEFANGEGGFYSALDADSLNRDNKLEEGAYYVWTKAELQDILEQDFEVFSRVFNINDFGYWEHGNYVLIQNDTLKNIADEFNLKEADLHSKKIIWEEMLQRHRQNRTSPRLDDKSLTSWNALMGTGLVDAFTAFGDKNYLKDAISCAEFILAKCHSANGTLSRNYKDGQNSINGYLEDYANTIGFLIALYQVTTDENWLNRAKQLTDYCFQNFYTASGFFAFTSTLDEALITRHFETEDNVIPASNSVMARNLLKLSLYFEQLEYEKVAHQMINTILPDVDYPSAYSNWLLAYLESNPSNIELAISGDDVEEILHDLQQHYLPNVTFAGTSKPSEIPFLSGRYTDDKTVFYLCRNRACNEPTESLEKIRSELKITSYLL